MTAAAAPNDSLLPRPPDGLGRGAALALLVHGGLIVALTAGVQWRATPPAAVSAELWASVPEAAAPRPVVAPPPPPPPPPPAPATARPAPPPPAVQRDAEIATERARRQQAETEALKRAEQERLAKEKLAREKLAEQQAEKKQREDAERQRLAEALKKREQEQRAQQAEDKRLAEQREQNLQRLREQAGAGTGAPGSPGTAAREAGPSASYTGMLIGSIKRNIYFGDTVPGNPAAEVEVRAAPNGTILARRLVKSSGHKEWDEAVLRAIDRTGTLPRDTDGRVPSTLIVAFRPNE